MLNILVAPNAKNSNSEKITKRIVRYLKNENAEFSVYFSPTINDVTDNTSALVQAGETDFVVIGDDSIVSEFINSVKDLSKIKLGIIPTSKHDDFASYLKLETNPLQAIKAILKAEVEPVDLLIMNDRKVLNNILIGASTLLEEVISQYKVKNAFTKNYALIKYGNKFDGIDLKIESKNQKAINANIFELSIANGGKANGKTVSPLANVNDGLFNFNYITTPQKENRRKYLRLFKKGEQIYNEQTKQLWLNNLKITNADNKIKAVVDGNIMTLESLNVSMLKNGLKLFKTN